MMPISSEPTSKHSPPPPQKTRRGTQTYVTSASVTNSPPPVIPSTSKEFKNGSPKHDNDYFVEEFQAYGRENVGLVSSTYLMPYV